MNMDEPVPQSVLYWDRGNFTLGSRVYLNNNPEPMVIKANLTEELDRIINTIQAFGVHTLYVNSYDDFVFLGYIKEHLKTEYNYNWDVKMEVKD